MRSKHCITDGKRVWTASVCVGGAILKNKPHSMRYLGQPMNFSAYSSQIFDLISEITLKRVKITVTYEINTAVHWSSFIYLF